MIGSPKRNHRVSLKLDGNGSDSSGDDKRNSSTYSLHDRVRMSEGWNSRHIGIFSSMIDDIDNLAQKHEKAGYYYKKQHEYWAFPAFLINGIWATLVSMINLCDDSNQIGKWSNTCALIVIFIFNSVPQFYKYSSKSEKHFSYANNFTLLKNRIKLDVSAKGVKYRDDPSELLVAYGTELTNMETSAPLLPQFLLK